MAVLNNFERETEVVHRDHVIKRQDDKERADSKEVIAEQLLPERRTAHEERQACATPPSWM